MNETFDKMKHMRLFGMARAFKQTMDDGKNENLTPDEMVSHLIESEWDERYNRKLDRSIKIARFRYKASVEQLSFEDNRVNKNQVLRLATCEFVRKKENIIITGST